MFITPEEGSHWNEVYNLWRFLLETSDSDILFL